MPKPRAPSTRGTTPGIIGNPEVLGARAPLNRILRAASRGHRLRRLRALSKGDAQRAHGRFQGWVGMLET
jgi:hypothetical protein